MSPRQAPGGMSRSQTPHQVPFPGYHGPANGGPQFTPHPGPYQHLQGTPPNVTQSPIMQDFDQHGVQRMGTASPSPFTPAGPQVGGPHMSPQSDHPSRVNTPQNNSFMPAQPFPQGMGPQFTPTPTMTSAAVQAPMQAPMQGHFPGMSQGYQQAMAAQQQQQQQQQQQRMHALQMQNQGRPMNMNPALAGRPVAAGMNAMANPQQMAAIRQMQQTMAKPPNPEAFMKSLQKFMLSRNLPLDMNPIVCGRPIHLIHLYSAVMKLGGSKKVTAANMWPVISQQLHFPPMQFPTAMQEIREHYQRNLAVYEQAFLSSQQKQFADQMQQGSLPRQPSDPSGMQFQSPTAKPGPGFENQQPMGQPSPGNPPVPHNVPNQAANGFSTPTPVKGPSKPPPPPPLQQQQQQQQHQQHQHRLSVSRGSQPPATPHDPSNQFVPQSPAQVGKGPGSVSGKALDQLDGPSNQPLKHPIEDPFKPMVLQESNLHGPIAVDEMYPLGEEITRFRPNVPAYGELGVIDIHALIMSVKSGIHAEMRVALDTLATISCEPAIQISLDNCEDLVDCLIECAEDQAELLAEHAAEVSDVMLLPSYEEISRGCQVEWTSLADPPEFGSLDYELDRAVDRLICVTTILRNFSFAESNFGVLSTPPVIEFFSTIIRYLGTRNMLLRTNQNTLDFMKDTVIYLSNLAHTIQVPSREEAESLLNFVLSFAPFPCPSLGPDGVMFTSYNASIHKYTPAAVDSFAKLLARDEPNRTFFRSIFSGDGNGVQQDLLTRAFGLAICPVPDQPRKPLAIADARKVFLMQGLLAADILSSFADGPLAKAWLESLDGFAIHLLRLSCLLSTERVPPPNVNARQTHAVRAQADEASAYSSIINRGLGILRRLAEKSKYAETDTALRFPSGIIPKKESLLGALLMRNVDPGVVRQLITYARLAE